MSALGESPGPPQPKPIRPDRSIPRNEAGEIICLHAECEGQDMTFKRPCEYNKHMDRHDRPFKCSVPMCEQNPGFTYSGGLLRHQREVHKMHLAKQPLYCPHSNCVRSTGTGFTRRENLDEHLRRRHSGSIESNMAMVSFPKVAQLDPLSFNRKRGRQMRSDEDDDKDESQAYDQPSEEDTTMKRLRVEVMRKDQIIAQKERELEHLRNFIASLPPQLMYHTTIPQSNRTI